MSSPGGRDSGQNDTKGRFIIRTYRPGDEARINEMFNEVFSQQRDLSDWNWKYRDNPYGSYFISLASAEDGTLAAHYAGYPVMLYLRPSSDVQAKEFMTCHIGDKMTRKQFRSVGLGRNSLLARTFMSFRETYGHRNGMPFAYGFTTHHSRRFGLLLLDYADIEPVPYRRLDLKAPYSMQVNRIKNLLSRIQVEEVSEIGSAWTEFFYRVAPEYRYLVKREAPYLNWRYLRRPDRRYMVLQVKRRGTLAGWSVFYREGGKIIWGDALFTPGDLTALKSMFRYLLTSGFCEGAAHIECWFPPRPLWWDSLLRAVGFKDEDEPNDLHLTPPIFTDAPVAADLQKYFYYSMGDSDLF